MPLTQAQDVRDFPYKHFFTLIQKEKKQIFHTKIFVEERKTKWKLTLANDFDYY